MTRTHTDIGKMMGVMTPHPGFKETFACTPLEARRARKAVAAFAGTWLEGLDRMEFESAIGEALANAVEHGRCSWLTIDCTYRGNKVVTEIHQDGAGFEPPTRSGLPEPGATRGYGLFIMRAVLDRVDYSEHGTCLRLVKRTTTA